METESAAPFFSGPRRRVGAAESRLRDAGKHLRKIVDELEALTSVDEASLATLCAPSSDNDRDGRDPAWSTVQRVVLPALAEVCASLDAVDLTVQQVAGSGGEKAPPAAPGALLSLQDYTAVNVGLELIVYWGIAPCRGQCSGIDFSPKQLSRSNRVPRRVMLWAVENVSEMTSCEAATRLAACADALQDLLLRDHFAPMLLTNFLPDIVAARWHAHRLFSQQAASANAAKAQESALEQLLSGEVSPSVAMAAVHVALQRAHGAAKPVPSWLSEAAGGCLTRILLRPGGVESALELFLGSGRIDAREKSGENVSKAVVRTALVLASIPRGMEPLEYLRAVSPQLRAVLTADASLPGVAAEAVALAVSRMAKIAPAAVNEAILLPLLSPVLLPLMPATEVVQVAEQRKGKQSNVDGFDELASEEEVNAALRALERLVLSMPAPPPLLSALSAMPLVPALFKLYWHCATAKAAPLALAAELLRTLLNRAPNAAPQLRDALVASALGKTGAETLPAARFAPGSSGGVAVRYLDQRLASEEQETGIFSLLGAAGLEDNAGEDGHELLAAIKALELDGAAAKLVMASPEGAEVVSSLAAVRRASSAAEAAATVLSEVEDECAAPGWLFYALLEEYFASAEASSSRRRVIAALASVLAAKLGPKLLTSGLQVLRCVGLVVTHEARRSERPAQAAAGSNVTDGSEKPEDEDISLAGVVLGLLLTLLEAGEQQRSAKEEDALRELLPPLQRLAAESRDADTAALAADAAAAIVARQRTPEERKEHQDRVLDAFGATEKGEGAVTWASMLQLLENTRRDMASAAVPIRACFVATLTKPVREFARRRWQHDNGGAKTSKVRKLTAAPRLGDAAEESAVIERYMDAFLRMAGDEDSYVYLAAVQGLVAMTDAWPETCIPELVAAFTGRRGASANDSQALPLQQRLKVGDAVMFSARRCGEAMPHYASIFVNALILGARERQIVGKGVNMANGGSQQPQQQPQQQQQPAEVQAFAAFRASCLTNLSEVCGLLGWAVRPFAGDIVDLCLGVLTLEAPVAGSLATAEAAFVSEECSSSGGSMPPSPEVSEVKEDAGSQLEAFGEEFDPDSSGEQDEKSRRIWEEKAAARRGAALLLSGLIRGCGGDVFTLLVGELAPLQRALRRTRDKDTDEATRGHAAAALDTLDAVVKGQLRLP